MLGRSEGGDDCVRNDLGWLLLDELSHRVGNEFMAMLAALQATQRGVRDGQALAQGLDQAIVRLENFCLVHRILDRKRPQESLRERLDALCRATATSTAAGRGIQLILEAEDVTVDDETAWTVCVVASEWMTNALKHAFGGDRRGELRVSLRADPDSIVLTVDDIAAWPLTRPTAPIPGRAGVGTEIVADLAGRLGGTATRRSGPVGATAVLTLPARRGSSDRSRAQAGVADHRAVNGAVADSLIPATENDELKGLLQTALKLFQEHQHHAEMLAERLG
jgi:two-component sensor histidine kinase